MQHVEIWRPSRLFAARHEMGPRDQRNSGSKAILSMTLFAALRVA